MAGRYSEGLYERVVTSALAQDLRSLEPGQSFDTEPLDPAHSHESLSRHLAAEVQRVLSSVPHEEKLNAQLTIVNRTGRALSLRLNGPQKLAIELGRSQSITRSIRPGVYYYKAAAVGLKTHGGVRRLLAGHKATWSWGRR